MRSTRKNEIVAARYPLISGVRMCCDASSGDHRPNAPMVIPMNSGMPATHARRPESPYISAPLMYGLSGLLAWVAGIPLFIGITIGAFGRWSPELASQHILTPLINGYLAATISFFLVDRIYRAMVY